MVYCPKCPEDVRSQMQDFICKKREQKSIMNMERPPEFEDVETLGIDENEEEDDVVQEIDSGKQREIIHGSDTSALKRVKVLQQ